MKTIKIDTKCESGLLSACKSLALMALILSSPFAILNLSAAMNRSNSVLVKAWTREDIHFDADTGAFSNTNIPSIAEALALSNAADRVDELYQLSIDAMRAQLAPLQERLDEARRRPVVTLALASAPENAVDRRNLTMCVMSNEIARIEGGIRCRFWIFGNNVLKSDPVMVGRVYTELGGKTTETATLWNDYGKEEKSVTIVDGGEEYECWELALDIPGEVKDGLDILVLPWVRVGLPESGFNFGNRQCRINGVMCTTTNDCSFLGTFQTTNGVDISALFLPYIDRGRLRFEQKEEIPE